MGKKTDDLDASRFAREARGRHTLATPAPPATETLAALLVARRSAVEMTGDTERQVVSLGATCPEQLDTKLRGKTTVQIVDTCSRWCPSGDPGLLGLAMR